MQDRSILVIEDEVTIAQAAADRLRAEGWSVEIAADGPSGVEACERLVPDAVVLDVMLPGFDGIEVCRRIQAKRPTPVLMLTARDSEADILIGLGVGADDYMTKPFSPRELVARVQALLRRVDRARDLAKDGRPLQVGGVAIDPKSRRVTHQGAEVHLTPLEFDLLCHLAARPGIVHPREQLLSDVWGYDNPTGVRTVDSHVKALRKKLGTDLIRTVHGVGYAVDTS